MIYDSRFAIWRGGAMHRYSSAFRIPRSAFQFLTACLVILLFAATSPAFPPAPYHTLYGTIRNQWGDPINVVGAEVLLETPTGLGVTAPLSLQPEPGVNYQLLVPMDSGTAPDLYHPTALRPFFQYRLKVVIGQTSYLPIEMAGNFSQIGQPSQRTRIDLTLGVDSDGDGLPDAWEQALIAIYGGNLGGINPNDDLDGDGISNLDEYLAGTYAFDPTDGFRLSIISVQAGVSALEFLAIRGRNYSLQASPDLLTWAPVQFRFSGTGASPALLDDYRAPDVRTARVEVPFQSGATNRYFRALVR
jgi:hypothetical protein